MRQRIQLFITAFVLVITSTFLQGFSCKPGGDLYRIYLNNKLLVEQFLTQPKKGQSITLDNLDLNDQLTIHYSHCGTAGKNGSITLKDEKGDVIKQWKFQDAKTTSMPIAVKEVLRASKGKSITIYYSSQELSSGMALASLNHRSSLVKL